MSKNRKTIRPETMRAVADEMAGIKLRGDELEARTAVMEALADSIAALRTLPLRDIEPAVVFQPVERGGRKSS